MKIGLRQTKLCLLIAHCTLFIAILFMGCGGGDSDPNPGPNTPTSKITITFNTDGGSAVAPVEIDAGGKLPADYFTGNKVPTKTNNNFNGWKNGATPVTADTTFSENTQLTAQWVVRRITVIFDLGLDDGEIGTPPNSVDIDIGTALKDSYPTPDPVRTWTWDGAFEFVGWYNGPTLYTKDTPITTNSATFTLFAEWEDNRIYTLAPAIHPGRHLDEAYPNGFPPVKAGEEFTIEGLFSNLPSEDSGSLTAQWYRATTLADAGNYIGVTIGEMQTANPSNPSRITLSYTGIETVPGDYWYWVEVTNTYEAATEGKTNSTRTMNQLKVTITPSDEG